MKQSNNFVIITQPRSGSYYFQSLLDSAGDIVCHGELFKKDRVEMSGWHGKSLGIDAGDVHKRDANPYQFVVELRKLNPLKIFGFKAFWPHLTPHKPLMNRLIYDESWKKIFLVRNPLQTYASLLRANKTNIWVMPGHRDDNGSDDQLTVHFAIASFDKHLKEYYAFMRRNQVLMNSQPASCVMLGYHRAQTMDMHREILKFLGSNAMPADMTSQYRKQFGRSLLEAFDNYDDLLTYIKANGLDQMLEEESDVFFGNGEGAE